MRRRQWLRYATLGAGTMGLMHLAGGSRMAARQAAPEPAVDARLPALKITDIKTILNAKIKRRESFRPFAPSVLQEAVSEWFEEDDAVPFMMQVFQIREGKRSLIPAVTHVDGSGRLQTVTREANPRYYRVIEDFRDCTGVPMVLNTSFNENEPVVCTPEEALDCFLRTQMDVLVMGNTFIHRRQPDE